jgi:hypothetical protein
MCAARPGKKVKRAQFTCHHDISVTVQWQSRVDYRTHQNKKEQKGKKSNDNEFTETFEHLLKFSPHFTKFFKFLVNYVCQGFGYKT